MILVNGCDAIGVGWSSYIPKYNLEKIIENIKIWLEDKPIKPMTPWLRGDLSW